MITWMTRSSFLDTAADLETDLLVATIHDSHDLFMQMVGLQDIVDHNAAAYRVWEGNDAALAAYVAALSVEATSRGIFSYLHLRVAEQVRLMRDRDEVDYVRPEWIEDLDVLRSHRSNMMRRWPDTYEWNRTPENWPYIWPFLNDEGGYDLMISKHDREHLANGTRSLPRSVRERIANL